MNNDIEINDLMAKQLHLIDKGWIKVICGDSQAPKWYDLHFKKEYDFDYAYLLQMHRELMKQLQEERENKKSMCVRIKKWIKNKFS